MGLGVRPDVSEAEFTRTVLDTARQYGWKRVHIRPGLTADGKWRTAYQGDTGLPDLILARNGRVLLVELKTSIGKATAAQASWLQAAGSNGRLWRPQHWDLILAELQHGTRLPAVSHLPREDDGT
jgi:hypothetical protein